VLQQPRVDVKGSLAVATFVLYNGRDVRQCESELTRNFRGGSWPPPQAPSVACDVWAAFGGFGLGDGRNESGLDPHLVYVRGGGQPPPPPPSVASGGPGDRRGCGPGGGRADDAR